MDKHRDENGAIGETEDEVEAHSPPIGQPPIGQPPIG